MARNLISEQQVKDALNIESFRNLSKDKIMEFVTLIPMMDKDVALSIINQFPTYSEMAKCMVERLTHTCDTVIADNSKSQTEVFSAYRKVLDDLGELLKREDISPEERDSISNKMIEIADKISRKDTENKSFLAWITRNKEYVIGTALVLGAAILGVSMKGKQLPKNK